MTRAVERLERRFALDATPPTVEIVDVSPDPRGTPVGTVQIVFSEPVTGFDRSDLNLDLNGDGKGNLLTAAQTLTTSDNRTWTLAGLSSLTSANGYYVLFTNAVGVQDLAGNPLANAANDQWTKTSDLTPPTADIVDVSPDPRNSPVDSVQIVFSEPVTGFDRNDILLDLNGDGKGNLLTAAQTVSTTDNKTFTLSGLAPLTATDGYYVVYLNPVGVRDAVGNVMTASTSDSWTKTSDVTAPTGDIADVAPDPRNTGPASVQIVFSEPVTGFTRTDLTLDLYGDGLGNLLTAADVLSTSDNRTFTLTLANTAVAPGLYTLAIMASTAGVKDAVGNVMTKNVVDQWTIDTTPPVATIGAVASPRATAVDSLAIDFSEPVIGFDLADLLLNGSPVAGTLSGGGQHWTLSLGAMTAASGNYVLSLVGSGLRDAAGNSPADVFRSWSTDATPPVLTMPVVTSPRNTPTSLAIVFSEPVALDLAHVSLTRDGVELLTEAPASVDGMTWTLPDATAGGQYVLTVLGVPDALGNVSGGGSATWTIDLTAPTAQIAAVTPDPRATGVGALAVVFSEPVTGLTAADLALTLDGVPLLIDGVITEDGQLWTVALNDAAEGQYTLTLNPSAAVLDIAGNGLALGAATSWRVDATPPAVSIESIASPRGPLDSLAIEFSEPVTLTLSALTINGGPVAADLTTVDGQTWQLTGLAGANPTSGTYELAVAPVPDAAGNYSPSASASWTVDAAGPVVTVDAVATPRNTPVDSLGLGFSEAAAISVSLTRDGGGNLLPGEPFAVDGLWTLDGLGAITAEAGAYVLTVTATDALGNVGTGGTAWTVDLAPPQVQFPALGPRNTPLGSIALAFNEPVALDLAGLSLTRDGGANLLTQDNAPAGGGRDWNLGNLSALTGTAGTYTLTVTATDQAGNVGTASVSWLVDLVAPTSDIVDVTPDPRNAQVGLVTIAFGEPVIGFDWTDLLFDLEGDGKGNLLTAPQALTGNGQTWTLDVSSFVQPGRYTLSFKTTTGIVDAAGNALITPLYDQWTIDATAPTVDVVDVSPDPRSSWVSPMSIVFSEKVTGFDLAHVSLTRDGGPNLLTAAQTFGSNDQRTWILGNLAGLTAPEGTYTLTVNPAGITDLAGNQLAAAASDTWTVATFLYVSVGDLRIGFDPRYNYYPTRLDRAGLPIMDYDGSTNGTVISLVGVGFVGGRHGHETLESVSLVVDGTALPVNGAGIFSGTEATLSRTTNLGGAYRMVHTLTISAAGIDDHVSLQGLDATKLVDKFYAFLGTRSNRLTDWTAYRENAEALGAGSATADNNANTYMPAGTWSVAQSDPVALDGVLTEWDVPDLGPTAFIIDRATDNKLYLDLTGLYGPADRSLEFGHRLRFF